MTVKPYKRPLVVALLAIAVQAASSALATERPPVPIWPNRFTAEFTVRVEELGPKWSAKGVIYYDWDMKVFRADYIDWCLPLFDSGNPENSSFSCSYLATSDAMYFVNFTSSTWTDNFCCLFEKGLGVVPPDWVKNEQYNGTANLRGKYCDVWWFPGTNDPEEPCYGYWNIRDKQNTPWQFFGLSSLGPTILEYDTFCPGMIPEDIDLDIPNEQLCAQQCEPPSRRGKSLSKHDSLSLPHFPSCE